MNEIIMAIGNEKLIKKIKQKTQKEYKFVQYREAILEILEINKKIEKIIIYENLPGQIEIEELINEIKKLNEKIKIILLSEKENYENLKKENIQILNIRKKKSKIKRKNRIFHFFGIPSKEKVKIMEERINKINKNNKIIIIDFNNNEYKIRENITIMKVKNKDKINYYLLKKLSHKYNCIFINNYDKLNMKNINKIIKLSDENFFIVNTEINLLKEQIKILKEQIFFKNKVKIKLDKKSKIHPRIIFNIFYSNNRKEIVWR